jgi:hypothetical protein
MYSHYGQTFYGYIYTYNNGVTKELENKLLNAKKEENTQYKQEKITTPQGVNEFNMIKLNTDTTIDEKELFLSQLL